VVGLGGETDDWLAWGLQQWRVLVVVERYVSSIAGSGVVLLLGAAVAGITLGDGATGIGDTLGLNGVEWRESWGN
jgi:hypothetical protein